MATCTIFKNFTYPVENVSLIILCNRIASGQYKEQVAAIRKLIAEGKVEQAQEKKQQLPAFTPSATFKEKRLLPNLDQYSGFVHLDFDKLSPQQMIDAFNIIASIHHTFCCFTSPSGNGLKVFVEVTSDEENHELAYHQVREHYEKATGLKADIKCKDITRLCFVSDDPQLYKNIYNEKFLIVNEIKKVSGPIETHTSEKSQPDNESDNCLQSFEQQILFTNQKSNYEHGNRNNYVYMLASNCNRAGINIEDCLYFCKLRFDLTEKEIKAAVESAYKHHPAEFAKFANNANLQNNKPAQVKDVKQESQPAADTPAEDYLKNTPSIPEELYSKMPELLRNGALTFNDHRERDVFLTGALAILSGCLPGVKGVYDRNEVFPNIFSFTIAPAASGKGALKFAKMLADEYHSKVLESSREADRKYNIEMAAQKQRAYKKQKVDASAEEPPIKPAFKVVYIPANTSYAKILSHLQQNEGAGIICETEADTLGNVFKQEWGSYSDMLRKSFHHERLSSSRKANDEFTEVNTPCLSIALSGTPNQVTGLIASSEDGLFSRFIFYAFKVEQKWKDVSPGGSNINLTEHFKALSCEVYSMVLFLEQQETEVELTSEQWRQLNSTCEAWLNDVTMFTAEEAASIVKRLGLILFRIAMLFTALRKFENAELSEKIICMDEDFQVAIELAGIYLHHSLLMFYNLPKQSTTTQFKAGDNKRKFIEALPNEFTTKEATEIGARFSLSYSSVTHLLPKLVPQYFTQPKFGHYQKNQQQ